MSKYSLKNHLKASYKYKDYIIAASLKYNISIEIIWGIGSRESGWGSLLTPPFPYGTGDFIKRNGKLASDGKGWGRGLMQIDYNAHQFARTGQWQDPYKNIKYGAKVLNLSRKYLSEKFKYLNDEELLKASIAAYNTGPGNVRRSLERGRDVDYTTHNRDYSKDVLRRAEWFKKNNNWFYNKLKPKPIERVRGIFDKLVKFIPFK